jgi:hypothetical protein
LARSIEFGVERQGVKLSTPQFASFRAASQARDQRAIQPPSTTSRPQSSDSASDKRDLSNVPIGEILRLKASPRDQNLCKQKSAPETARLIQSAFQQTHKPNAAFTS